MKILGLICLIVFIFYITSFLTFWIGFIIKALVIIAVAAAVYMFIKQVKGED